MVLCYTFFIADRLGVQVDAGGAILRKTGIMLKGIKLEARQCKFDSSGS